MLHRKHFPAPRLQLDPKAYRFLRRPRNSQVVTRSPQMSFAAPSRPMTTPAAPKTQVFYAIVLHDFSAERDDELDAKRGDAITVVAQSNREWFVAKHIGRIGRPGLIPVSFVEIHDPATGKAIANVEALIDRGELPKVEDWKRAMLNYKQNSISLGVIDAPNRGSMPSNPFPHPANNEPPRPESPEPLPEGLLLNADVVSFHHEMDEYWFRIDAIYQPYSRPGQSALPPAKQMILFRVYNDFYDFQVSLLESFPREAGREGEPRTLPYMPGPAQEVDNELTATRRIELDEYAHALCNLSRTGQRYIVEHEVVRKFLGLKPGDVENDIEPRTRELEEILATDGGYENDVHEEFTRMKIRDEDGSDYGDDGPQTRHPYNQAYYDQPPRAQPPPPVHQRTASNFSNNPSSYHTRTQSRSNSPYSNGSPQLSNGYPSPQQQWSEPPIGLRTSQASSRSRSHSTGNNLNTPPISAANPQTAFVKIKIFDRVADDLIAIRVHPRVSHSELMNKVQSRLGGDVATLRYRDSMTNTFVGLGSDNELRVWMEGTDKHVLYAD